MLKSRSYWNRKENKAELKQLDDKVYINKVRDYRVKVNASIKTTKELFINIYLKHNQV